MSDCIFPSTQQPLDGYVRVWDGHRITVAHRVAWEAKHRPIPDGYDPHHTCRARGCINLEHLELVDHAEHARLHNAEITHCPQGHEYTPENTIIRIHKTGARCRNCRECANERSRRWWKEVGRDRYLARKAAKV